MIRNLHHFLAYIRGIKKMKYKVLKDFVTSDGVLYAGEFVKKWDAIMQTQIITTYRRLYYVVKK